jgi:hypothetical protein
VFGNQPRLPVDVALLGEQDFGHPASYPAKLAIRLLRTRELVCRNLDRARAMQEKYYNKSTNLKQFETGDWVLLWRPNLNVGGAKKLTHPYIGPFQVTARHGVHNYSVQDPSTGRVQRVNVQRLKLFHGEVCVDLWNTAADDVQALQGEMRTRRGRPRTTLADPSIVPTEPRKEDNQEEIEAIVGERLRRNTNGLTESQFQVRWRADKTLSWIWARDLRAPHLLAQWTNRSTVNFVCSSRGSMLPRPFLHVALLMAVVISFCAANQNIEQFFTMTAKPAYPIYKCWHKASHLYSFPQVVDCSQLTETRRPEQRYHVEIWSHHHAAAHLDGCFCWRTMESCTYTMFFFGAKTARCFSNFTDISELECASACQEKVSADGPLLQQDGSECGTSNAIQETYAWPTTIIQIVYNTHTASVPIMVSDDDSSLIVASIPLASKCHYQQGYCSTYHKGKLIWSAPIVAKQCPLQKVASATCSKMGYIRCPGLNADFDLVHEQQQQSR